MALKSVCLYVDEGADPTSVRTLVRSLREARVTSIRLIDRHVLYAGEWMSGTEALFVPGGRDIPYDRALRGPGTDLIRRFVETGGTYVGFCAGAYFGAAFVEFERGYPLEVIESRTLCFFPGSATGPAYGPGQFCYDSERGARLSSVRLQDGTLARLYFNGGCAFERAADYPNIELLATYDDIEGTPAAIIRCRVGKGCALLSGVHPEYGSHTLRSLAPIEEERRRLFNALFVEI